MIARLRGILVHKDTDYVIMDVNGVGYKVQVSAHSLTLLPPVQTGSLSGAGEVILHTDMHVREDAMSLFGFVERAEQDMFRYLTSVQGVGAKLGLTILSSLGAGDIHRAIIAGDKAMLTRASGVGPKLAARLITELKDKFAGQVGAHLGQSLKGTAPKTGKASAADAEGKPALAGDAVSALINLGYSASEVHGLVLRLESELGEQASLQNLIAGALKELARS